MPGAVAFLKQDALHNFHSETATSTWAPDDLLFVPKTLRASRGAGFLVEAPEAPVHPTSFGHGHHAPPGNPQEALEQAKAGFKTCMLGFMASSAALLSSYVTWSLEKEHFEHEVHEHHQRHGARH